MTFQRSNPRPAPTSSIVAVVVAAAVILVLGENSAAVRQWLSVGVAGLFAVALGTTASRGAYRLGGGLLAVLGGSACIAAVVGLGTDISRPSRLLTLVPGFLGLFVVAGTLVPIRGQGSRSVVKVGAAGLFAGVLFAGLFQTVPFEMLLGTTIGTVVAWDAGEHAIGVGEQLGRRATTWRLEVGHIAGTALVGVAGAFTVKFVDRFANSGLSLASFGLIFLAILLLLAALR